MPGSATPWNHWTPGVQAVVPEQPTLPSTRQSLARAAADAQRELLAATEAAEHAVARAYALSQQLERALEVLERSAEPPAPCATEPGHPWANISPREREVLALVAEGRSNKAIAEALFVSPNTVKTHVAALLTKLEVESRVQLAALATRHGNWPEAA
ncbi:MAG: response regulator transcription factor [Thermomicrobiales bacterium]